MAHTLTPLASIDETHQLVQANPSQANYLRQQAWHNLQLTDSVAQAYRQSSAPAKRYAQGLLNGISVSVKDLYGVQGMDTYAGTPFMFPDYQSNGPLVQALIDQGAYITGKTHTVEFAFGGLGTNPHWPVPKNPADIKQHRVPGGSSSGAPVSLLNHTCHLALGTDTSGSVRVPAAMCGTFGIKTSTGRWSKEQIVPLSPSIDTPGLLARSAADALWGFAIMDGIAAPLDYIRAVQAQVPKDLQGVRIGYIAQYFNDCEDVIGELAMATLTQCQAAGAQLVALEWPHLEESWQLFLDGGLSAVEFPEFIFAPENQHWFANLADTTKMRFMHLLGTHPEVFAKQIVKRNQQVAMMQAAAHECLAQVDFAVCPTVPISAPILSDVRDDLDAYKDRNLKALSHTQLANYQNLCAASLPIGNNQAGLPCGLQLIMPHNEDQQLMHWCLTLEQLLNSKSMDSGTGLD